MYVGFGLLLVRVVLEDGVVVASIDVALFGLAESGSLY